MTTQSQIRRGGLGLTLVAATVLLGVREPATVAQPERAVWVRVGERPVGFPPPPQAAPPNVLPTHSAPQWGARQPPTFELIAGQEPLAPKPADPPVVLPQPKPLPPDEPGMLDRRLPGLAGPFGTTPKPSAEVKARFDKYVGEVVDPQNTLDLVVNRNRLLRLKDTPARVQLTDETVSTMTVVTPRELSLTGKKVGTTVLTLWFGDPKEPGKQEVLVYLVRVLPDPEYRERVERVYEALAGEINRAFPDSAVKLQLVGDKLVVSGQAKDVYEAYQILRVARANAPRGTPADTIPVGQVNVTVPPDAVAAADGPVPELSLANFLTAGGPNVINQLRVGGEHQVMLKVTVAEVNRAAARSVGINFDIARKDGLVVFANRTGNIANGLAGVSGGTQVSPLNNLPVLIGGGQVAAAVNALKSLNLAKSLAEPTLTTLNGRPASFQSGGQFPVPVVTGFTAAGLQGVTYVPFGVSLNFTPVVTDDDRVRMTVSAEVSTRDASTSQTSIGGAAVPSLNSRNFQTTVELRAGETLAVAGLVQNNFGSDASRVPFFGDIPIAGRLFAFDRTSNADQELVVLITPYLVHPLGKHEVKPLPGSDLVPPSDVEFYLLGRLQHYPPAGVVGAGGPLDPAAARRRRKCEEQLLVGPVGYTER